MKKLTWWQILLIAILGVGVCIGYAFILDEIDIWVVNQLKIYESIYDVIEVVFGFALAGPIFDGASEVLQIGAQILCIKRYAEQWPLWIGTNILSITMWISVIVVDPTSLAYAVPTLIMWIAYLVNAFYGASFWYKSSKKPLDTE